jgi:DNA-binding LytR/AlgR family response regulator
MKKIIIVEDEALIADHLAAQLESIGYEVVAIVDRSEDLFLELDKQRVDLILLDIQIEGDLDGVDVAQVLNQNYKIPFVFISSNTDDRTLSRVRHTQPSGFISKPFNLEQLRSVLKLIPEPVAKNSVADQGEPSFFIKDTLGHIRVNYRDILYAKADDNYTQLITTSKRHVLSSTLKEVESKLLPFGFIRCHRSYIVNLSKVDRIGANFVTINAQEIPVSESYRKQLTDSIDLL